MRYDPLIHVSFAVLIRYKSMYTLQSVIFKKNGMPNYVVYHVRMIGIKQYGGDCAFPYKE